MNIMLLKRLAAFAVALILVVQLTACRPNTSVDDTSRIDTSSLAVGTNDTLSSDISEDNPKEDIISDSYSSSLVGGITDNGSEEIPIVDITSSETQDTDVPQQDNNNETNNGNSVTGCTHGDEDPYLDVSKSEFYADYKAACCNTDASYRSKHGFLSGSLEVPGQYATETENRPMLNGKFVRNTAAVYLDNGNTYMVMDADGREVMRIHKAGGYITLEEVAAYMYAFGGSGKIPANYISKKKGRPNSSIWGEYLRVNHSYFIGDTDKYPYEPELPNISGCGGDLRYYEMDIGTTGTSTPGYPPQAYIQGNSIERGAARIVYARDDLNGNGVYENNEVYVFYTHNHYNDFREYLNYYGGWGEMFGNVTGGGEYSSKYNANPTPYVPTAYADFTK
ncbi:MAG: hypothetical protein E7521_02175 [Ruminococcaceae bacterium]|nr:hypothetical protein [Oscillospiraceae bacterium]